VAFFAKVTFAYVTFASETLYQENVDEDATSYFKDLVEISQFNWVTLFHSICTQFEFDSGSCRLSCRCRYTVAYPL